MKASIPENQLICNFLKTIGLDEICSRIVLKHIIAFLTAMAIKGFSAKMTDVEEISQSHRTTLSYFISKSPWNVESVQQTIKSKSYQHIQQCSERTRRPIFVSIDDTVNCKTKPSSQALRPIQGANFHHSHLLGKRVWGHQVQAAMISCGEIALNYDIHRYDKTKQSKIAYAQDLITELPIPEAKAYVMADSWYTCGKIMDSCAARGYHYIGAMKTNRIIYPQGIRISIADFAATYIELNDVDLVTVHGKEYYVYRYEGKLNDIDSAVALLSWPKEAFKTPKALKAFICTDIELDTKTILTYYTERWCIETFFSQSKDSLGFSKYQIRSIEGIERLWTLMSLFHLLCSIGLGSTMPFGVGLRLLRKNILNNNITFIYQSAQNDVPLEDIIDLYA